MPITPTSVEATAATQVRAALSRSATLHAAFGVAGEADPAAAALARIFIVDSGDTEDNPQLPPYALVTVTPAGCEALAHDLVRYDLDVEVECWLPQPPAAANAGEDYLAGLNLGDVAKDLRADAHAANLNFEITSITPATPVRDDEWAEGTAGDIGMMIVVSLEAWGD